METKVDINTIIEAEERVSGFLKRALKICREHEIDCSDENQIKVAMFLSDQAEIVEEMWRREIAREEVEEADQASRDASEYGCT